MTVWVLIIGSGYMSLMRSIKREPRPDPVPPPMEWTSWNPCKHSQSSASFLYQKKLNQWLFNATSGTVKKINT